MLAAFVGNSDGIGTINISTLAPASHAQAISSLLLTTSRNNATCSSHARPINQKRALPG